MVVEEEYTETETRAAVCAGPRRAHELGQEDVPVAHSRVVFDAPAALPLRTDMLLLPDMKPVRTEAGGRVTLTFDVGSLDGIDPREPNLPPDVVRFPIIGFATGASWQSVATEYGKIVDSHAGSAAVKAVVDPLIAGKKSAAEKEAAIRGLSRPRGAIHGHRIRRSRHRAARSGRNSGQEIRRLQGQSHTAGGDAARGRNSRQRGAAQCRSRAWMFPQICPAWECSITRSFMCRAKNPLWIDATDRYAQLGQLPMGDQGRLALIASADDHRAR